MSSCLSIIVTIGLSGTSTEIQTCNIFVYHGYIFEKRFSPNFLFTYCWPLFKLYLKSLAQTLTEKIRHLTGSAPEESGNGALLFA